MAEHELALGQKYTVRERFEAVLKIEFFTPASTDERCTLPVFFAFTIWDLPAPPTGSVTIRPVEEDRWEQMFVTEKNRLNPLYGGYSLSIRTADLLKRCDRLWV
jgi:hypothetical protein